MAKDKIKTSKSGKVRTVYRKVKSSRVGKKAKGLLPKVKKFAVPGAAALTVYGKYAKRSKELFAAGLIEKEDILKAIQYDVKNFEGTDAMERLKTNAGEIVTPFLISKLVTELKPVGKYSGLVADLAMGFGVGIAANTILDPPIEGAKQIGSSNTGNGITVISSQETASPEMQAQYTQIQPQIGVNPLL